MIKKIHVHLSVNVTKKFDVDIPSDSDYLKFVKALLAKDPACRNQKIKNVIYDIDTEVPVSVQFFIKTEKLMGYGINRTLHERLNKLSLFMEEDQPLQAFEKLIVQASKDPDSLAKEQVKLVGDACPTLTVDELLAKIKV